jgi:hypothetical protein
MGGLVVLQAAQRMQAHSVILLEPSAPAEIQGYNPDVPLAEGVFDPEAEYGTFPAGIEARPESLLARTERKRGISIASLSCPSLVLASCDFPDERGRLDLVLHSAPHQAIADFLGTPAPTTAP